MGDVLIYRLCISFYIVQRGGVGGWGVKPVLKKDFKGILS